MALRPKCYILYPVKDNPPQLQEILYWSTLDAVDANKFYNFDVTISGIYGGTYYVVLNPDQSNCPNPSEVVVTDEPTAVAEYCYYVTSGAITYVNIDDELVSAAGPANICTKIIPQVSTSGSTTPAIVFNGECVEGQPCVSQPTCYLLTSCDNPSKVIQSKSSALETFWAQNKIVSLVGEDGCWTISKAESVEDCDCAVSVVVSKSYATCNDCLPVIAYRVTNCETGEVKFTEQDLAAYVGKTITESECGGCWSIEQINIKPPTTSVISIVESFKDCEICLRDYWILTDCEGSAAPIITHTDMTTYVGKIINLVNNPICWNVESVLIPGQESVEVNIAAEFETCIACKPKAEVECVRVTNDSAVLKTYQYYIYDNTGEILELQFTLEPNETSDKFCSAGWAIPIDPVTDIVIQYGPCTNIYEQPVSSGPTLFNDNPWVCPVQRTGRLVEPGYTVPACTPDKFESISCTAAEILYHRVLTERYGISNCCPEEDEQSLIRKELIDLASLRDKSIVCTISTDCCSNPYCN